jgi:prolyl-tRNA synthetase
MLEVYRTFMEQWMALPVLTGMKTDAEKFAGAVRTYGCEGLMQDNKALQAGTSHFLGQNFAKAFGVQYQTATGGMEYVWSTSWGASTRLIGGLVMAHGDDVGIVCPPRLAPLQVVIVPIWKGETERESLLDVAGRVRDDLRRAGVRVDVDARDGMKPGAKYYEWEGRGVPLRLELGPRDLAKQQVMAARRTGGKAPLGLDGLADLVVRELETMQDALLAAARARRDAASVRGVTKEQLIERMDGPGGFAYGGYCGDAVCEQAIKDRTKATIRVLPDPEFRSAEPPTTCVWCGRPAQSEAVWAKAY